MTSQEFVKRIRHIAYDSSIRNTISEIEVQSVKHPSRSVVALSRWYHSLGTKEKDHVRLSIEMAARSAIFGVFCMLDGVLSSRITSDEPVGEYELKYISDGVEALLNPPHGPMLHEFFSEEVPPHSIEL